MKSKQIYLIVVGAALLLPACSYTEEVLWPSLTGEEAEGTANTADTVTVATNVRTDTSVVAQQSSADDPAQAAPPQPVARPLDPQALALGPETGTYVSKKIAELRGELVKLRQSLSSHDGQFQAIRASTVENAQRFQSTLASINARLQVGTTPGNPVLIKQYNSALVDLDRMGDNIARLGELSQGVTADSTLSAYISDSVRAALTLSGAVDEDHRQLAVLAGESSRTAVLVERLLTELSDDLRRETAFVRTARANLSTLSSAIKIGEILGDSLATGYLGAPPTPSGTPQRPLSQLNPANASPLVVIRFDRSNIVYQQAPYNAVSSALKQHPQAAFDLVAVTPSTDKSAQMSINSEKSRRNADGVLRSLVEMGLPKSKVVLSSKSSVAARSNEVHLYLR